MKSNSENMRANNACSSGKVLWLCLTLLAFCLALGVSWMIWAQLNFAYEFLYGLIDIDQHIAQYAPNNLYKTGFALTSEAERFRLFGEVVRAIHQQGEGLAALAYSIPQGQSHILFTHDEVLHLQDVATLIDRMKWLLYAALAVFTGLFASLYRRRIAMPSFTSLLAYAFLAVLLVTGIILLIGAHEVFYQLHIWVFPEENKWFFYYEESLMSTMMKAPDLFAYIAILLVALGLVIFIVIMWLLRLIFIKRIVTHD